jgi:hypothetical protein
LVTPRQFPERPVEAPGLHWEAPLTRIMDNSKLWASGVE